MIIHHQWLLQQAVTAKESFSNRGRSFLRFLLIKEPLMVFIEVITE